MQSAILGIMSGVEVWLIRSFIYIRKSVGEITKPWGTPAFVEKDSDVVPQL